MTAADQWRRRSRVLLGFSPSGRRTSDGDVFKPDHERHAAVGSASRPDVEQNSRTARTGAGEEPPPRTGGGESTPV